MKIEKTRLVELVERVKVFEVHVTIEKNHLAELVKTVQFVEQFLDLTAKKAKVFHSEKRIVHWVMENVKVFEVERLLELMETAKVFEEPTVVPEKKFLEMTNHPSD